MDKRIYWIWLSRIHTIGFKRLSLLLKEYEKVENLWKLKAKELKKVKNIGEKTITDLLDDRYRKNLDKYLEYMEKNQIDIISIQDTNYPKQLKEIYDPPIAIYIKGNQELLNSYMIAIVGSRNCSSYGRRIALDLSEYLSNRGATIVSGLAKGIDAYSHIGSIKGKGKTLAVLGSGLAQFYPKENISIARDIIKNNGAIISEYPIDEKADRMNFPARNRIISGMSDKVIVIEARKNSGSFITVDYALEQGKEVYAVPGNITSKLSDGTNELIKDGANIVTNYKDILG